MFGLFRKASPEQRRRTEEIKALVRAKLGIGEAGTISVSEIDCGDPACPGAETVILIMLPGHRTRACRVPAPLMEVEDPAIEEALEAPAP